MGAWRENPTSWPIGMPSPGSDGWTGWARHWLAAQVSPVWLTRTAIETRLPLAVQARLAWRLRAGEASALDRSVGEGGALRRSLRDAQVPEEVADQVVAAVEDGVVRRRRTLAELEAVGRHL